MICFCILYVLMFMCVNTLTTSHDLHTHTYTTHTHTQTESLKHIGLHDIIHDTILCNEAQNENV